jgi:molybdopterin-containing oxidoreductase family membrane subunit
MWFERFVIIATSLTRTWLPSAWSYYVPTRYDVGVFVGTMGLFLTLFTLFMRFLPSVAIAEVKNTLPEAHAGKDH